MLDQSVFVLVRRFVDKFTEFLRLFVSIHLRRFEANSMFPMLDFLSLLFQYTFKQVRALASHVTTVM